jgi:hypothetical protein
MKLFDPLNKNDFVIDQHVNYPLEIGPKMLEKAGEDMAASKSLIPRSHFDGSWDNVVAKTGRGVDRLDFLLYVTPTLLIPRMKSGRTSDVTEPKKIMNQLIIACHLCLQWNISQEERALILR